MKAELEIARNEIRQNDKRYDERFARIEVEINEMKNDLRQVFKARPGTLALEPNAGDSSN